MATSPVATTSKATKPVRHRTMQDEYGVYNFVDKDPVIDVLRSMIDLEAKVAAKSFGGVCHDIADATHISPRTLHLWFFGPTVSPRFCFVQRVAIALGYEFEPTAVSKRRRGKTH